MRAESTSQAAACVNGGMCAHVSSGKSIDSRLAGRSERLQVEKEPKRLSKDCIKMQAVLPT
jgi:hypothetical protein